MLKYLFLSVACSLLMTPCNAEGNEIASAARGKNASHHNTRKTSNRGIDNLPHAQPTKNTGPVIPEEEIAHPPSHGKHDAQHYTRKTYSKEDDNLPHPQPEKYKGPGVSADKIVPPPHGKHDAHRGNVKAAERENINLPSVQSEKIRRSRAKENP
ncbi:MAG: hypothetical protein K0M45_11415 [Candidatus Paracaedibacteraceae bacterium]|nr:hypothetical protein [Candidatus Paracaedibacteraceae bacterium]